jgi:hypothetical protein
VNSGNQKVAAYGLEITFDADILAGDSVEAGADGFVAATNIEPGLITTSGFDIAGKGPRSDLELLVVNMTATGSGTTQVDITVNRLVDENTNTIGIPKGIGGTVTVNVPVTPVPTDEPTAVPTDEPTAVPTDEPTAVPTDEPTAVPTDEPTAVPTDEPTAVPTDEPTAVPTDEPTAVPTDEPTAVPTDEPTAVPTDEPTAAPTAEPTAVPKGAGSVWLDPDNMTVGNGENFTMNVHCHTGSQKLAAYGIDFLYDASVITVNTGVGNNGVEAGPDGFIAAINSPEGQLITSGFDLSGKGPGNELNILKINWTAAGVGTTDITINVKRFVDPATADIGTLTGHSATVTVN